MVKVPNDWHVEIIEDIYNIKRGIVLSTEKVSKFKSNINKYPVYSSQTLDNGLLGYYNEYLFEDSITWTTDGANAGTTRYRSGRFYSTNVSGALSSSLGYANHCMAEMINKETPKYVSYVGNPKLMSNVMAKIPVLFPPLDEQKEISSIFIDFSEHIENINDLIEKKKAIRDGALEELITGKTRLKGYKDIWEKVSFDDVIIPKARIGWQGLKSQDYLTMGYSYLISGTDFVNGFVNTSEISFVSKERFDMDPNIQVKENDVLVTKDGTIGKVALVPNLKKPATLNSGVFVFRTNDRLYSTYLYRVLMSTVFKNFIAQLSAGSTIQHLYQKDLKNFEFYIPTDKDEQIAISEVLMEIDKDIIVLEDEKEKLLGIEQGVKTDLLSGKVRLKITKGES